MKIAIVGTGISALTCAHRLHKQHDLTLYEATDWIGGHTHTVDVEVNRREYAVDTGFIVFNHKTYPNFLQLLGELYVPYQQSCMSFSVKCDETGLEYGGSSLGTLFAQKRNIAKPNYLRMLYDITRFYRNAEKHLKLGDERSLGQFLSDEKYSQMFVDKHIVPMAAAVWSAPPSQMMEFPLKYLLRFFHNHGFTQINNRPQWYVITGGSREYVKKLVEPFKQNIRLNQPVMSVSRSEGQVSVVTSEGEEHYDEIIFSCHSDTALKLLADPTPQEEQVLGNIPYQANSVVLHTDASLMPKKKKAWASWNYRLPKGLSRDSTVTYWMNRLQGLPSDAPDFFVSLNQDDHIDPSLILRTFNYEHPIYTDSTLEAQAQHGTISGHNRTHYCGAYWFYGFHEDGVKSGLRVVENISEKEKRERERAA
ncbi:MAG: FAD-dependent oxidoreductase [Myxococcota bacterium]|nr:FAD-dependent oxidoreductase [Myxococcota bacterium]